MSIRVSLTTTVPPTGSSARTSSTRPRLCGLCRCPGHTRGHCPVIEVHPPSWFSDFGDVNVENNGQANAMVRKIIEMSSSGIRQAVLRENYLISKGYNPTEFRNFPGYKYVEPTQLVKNIVIAKIMMLRRVQTGECTMDDVWRLPEEFRSTDRAPLSPADLRPIQRAPATPATPIPQVQEPEPEPRVVVKDKVIDEQTCPICMDKLTECNRTVVACGHQFHTNCIFSWAKQPRSSCKDCPTCRAPIFE